MFMFMVMLMVMSMCMSMVIMIVIMVFPAKMIVTVSCVQNFDLDQIEYEPDARN